MADDNQQSINASLGADEQDIDEEGGGGFDSKKLLLFVVVPVLL